MAKYGSAIYGLDTYSSRQDHPYTHTAGRVMWLLQVDWDGDGLFGSEIEPQAIRALRFSRGRGVRVDAGGSGQNQPSDERFEISLVDPDGRYNQLNPLSPVYAGLGAPARLLRLLLVDSSSRSLAQPVFTGALTGAQHDPSSGFSTLSGQGLARWLQLGAAESMHTPVQTSPGYDSYFVWNGSTPTPFNYWKGRPGGLTLRECTALTLGRAGWTLGAAYGSGEANPEGTEYFFFSGESGWELLSGLADAFAARLFFLRDGRLFVMDRLDSTGLGQSEAPQHSLSRPGLRRFSPFHALRNRVEMRVRPHSVPPFNSPYPMDFFQRVWFNAGPIRLAPGEQLELDIRYPRTVGSPLQGSFARVNYDLVTPDGLLYEAWSAPDKTGTKMDTLNGTSEFTFNIVWPELGASQYAGKPQDSCRVILANASSVRTAYAFNLAVLLAGVREVGQPLTVALEDMASQSLNGLRLLTIDSRWVQDSTLAAAVGASYLEALSQRERVSPAQVSYHWSGQSLFESLQAYDLGYLVNFGHLSGTASQRNFGLQGRWQVVGQQLEWPGADGQAARVQLTYEKCAAGAAVALSGTVSTALGAPVHSLQWSHTVPAGEKRLLVLALRYSENFWQLTQVTYAGLPLTHLCSKVNDGRVELWALPDAPVGTAQISLAWNSDVYVEAGAVNLVNVDEVTPWDEPVSAGGSAGTAELSLQLSAGDLALDVIGSWSISAPLSPSAGQTALWSLSSDGAWRSSCSTRSGSGPCTMQWSAPGQWAMAGVVIKASG